MLGQQCAVQVWTAVLKKKSVKMSNLTCLQLKYFESHVLYYVDDSNRSYYKLHYKDQYCKNHIDRI